MSGSSRKTAARKASKKPKGGAPSPGADGEGKEVSKGPKREMNFHLVPVPLMADVMDILRKLPYEDVFKVMPQLGSTQVMKGTEK